MALARLKKERKRYGSFHYRFLNGESCADVYDRMSRVLDTMYRDWEESVPENVVVVTHGMTMRVFLMRLFKWRPERFERVRNPRNRALVVVEQQRDGNYKLKTSLKWDPAR